MAIIAVILALVVAAGAGIGAVWVLNRGDTDRPTDATSAGPTTPPPPTVGSYQPPETTIVQDISGFMVAVPTGWVKKARPVPQVTAYGPTNQPDDKNIRVQFSQPGNARNGSAYDEFKAGSDSRVNGNPRVPGYTLVSVTRTTFAGIANGARWEFTWTDKGVPRRNILYGAATSDGRNWQLATIAPKDEFNTYAALFDQVVANTKITA